MIYILYGLDSYSSRKELQRIKDTLGDPEILSVNTNVLNGAETSPGQLRDMCRMVPFMNPFRLIIVEGLLDLFEPEFKQRSSSQSSQKRGVKKLDEWKLFIDSIQDLPESTILIFMDAKVTRNNTLLKILGPHAKVKSFPQLRDRELYSWINDRVSGNGGSINPSAMRLLIEYSNNDLWTLSNEIEKLIAYCSGRQIAENDVMQLTCYSREANVFNLVDAIFNRKVKQTHNILQRLLSDGTNTSFIIAMIARQLRLIIKAKYLDENASTKQALQALNMSSEFILNKTKEQAGKYSITQLSACYHRLLQADIDIKTGKYNEEVAVDLLVADLCRY
jgi:DNA polymerase-3 subunit delta